MTLIPSSTRNSGTKWTIVTAYVVVCLIWGTTWLAMKIAVRSIPPLTAAGLRFTLAFPALAIVILVNSKATFFHQGKNWLLMFLAVFYIAIPYALINYGEKSVSSGLAALIFASVTVFLLVFSRLISGTRTTSRQWAGVITGIVLLGVLLKLTSHGFTISAIAAPAAILAAAVLHALCYAVLGRYGKDVHVLTTEGGPVALGGLMLLVVGIMTEKPDWRAITPASWGGIIYLALIASVFGFAAYFYLLKMLPPLIVSYVFVLFPVVSTFFSSVVEGTHLSLGAYVTAALMLLSFALTKTRRVAE